MSQSGSSASPTGVTRRGLIGGTAAGAATVAGLGLGVAAGNPPAEQGFDADSAAAYDFRGVRQSGIVTPAQDRLHIAAFDVTTSSRAQLIALLKAWTEAAERMMAGNSAGPVGPTQGDYDVPPDDTGEAIGLPASGLTITFGFGPGLFGAGEGRAARDRFGLAARRPESLTPLPHFPADVVEPARSEGDLVIQACAHDPQVAVHAIRNLTRIGFGTVSVRWSQLGFGRTSTTTRSQSTPRNLFGYKDGTMNIRAEETAALDEHVWVGAGESPDDWLAGGSYLVARRIKMNLEIWDRQTLGDQDGFIGRLKDSGAPLTGGDEFAQPDFEMPGRGGPLMPVTSHVSVVHPDHNGGVRMLRRGYNFVDGSDPLGGLDAGLFFIAFLRDPLTQFVPMQTAMAKNDALMEYLRFTSSSVFAVPPGIGEGEYVGQALFA